MKWAGEETLDHDKTGNLRRAPTPFPKEMRAMAKKVLHMKEKRALEEERNNKRRTNREFRQRGVGKSVGVDEYDKVHKHGVLLTDAFKSIFFNQFLIVDSGTFRIRFNFSWIKFIISAL